ncbi:MAG: hypothetical protein GX103_10285, partial [Bacteroidales bacterium]|nr:hypothetical protein [Bacteroidales bacterium]
EHPGQCFVTHGTIYFLGGCLIASTNDALQLPKLIDEGSAGKYKNLWWEDKNQMINEMAFSATAIVVELLVECSRSRRN